MSKRSMLIVERSIIEDALAAVSSSNDSNWSSRLKEKLSAILEEKVNQQCEPAAWKVEVDGMTLHHREPMDNPRAKNTPLYEKHEVKIVMPDRELYTKYLVGVIPHNANEVNAYKDGWNTCLEETARLNGIKP